MGAKETKGPKGNTTGGDERSSPPEENTPTGLRGASRPTSSKKGAVLGRAETTEDENRGYHIHGAKITNTAPSGETPKRYTAGPR